MFNVIVFLPMLVFAGWFWYRLGKWTYLHGKSTYRAVIMTIQRLVKFKEEAIDLYRKQG
jgi:hypothetical protein